MKNMKTGIISLLCVISLYAQEQPRFHLKNKSGKAIAVILYKDDAATEELDEIQMQYIEDIKSVDPRFTNHVSINPKKVDQIKAIKISFCDNGKTQCAKNPDGYVTVGFDLGKISPQNATYYISFYINKKGEPSIELQKGLFGKTTEGYSLKNNIRKIINLESESLVQS